MTTTEPKTHNEPEAGNYFVSAYPPFSCWQSSQLDAVHRVLDSRVTRATIPLGLYLHVPFCVHRCQFCYYRSFSGKTRLEMDGYVDSVLSELSIYGSQPVLVGRNLDFVYFGGGTPSMLSVEQLEHLLPGVQAVFPWNNVREVTFECAPKTTTRRRLELLRSLGVTRISMGVQQLNDAVLRTNGRIHLVRDVERAYAEIQAVGFDTVNIDLIAGLVSETEASFFTGLEQVIEMAPDSITIYPLEIPENTPLYAQIDEGLVQDTLLSWDEKRQRISRAFALLEGAGYSIQTAYTAVRDTEQNCFVYQDAQYHGADLMGAGVASFSYLSGVHYQNVASLDKYRTSLSSGELPLKRAHVLSMEEQMVREFVLQLKLGGVDAAYFRGKFGVEIASFFASPLHRLSQEGWLSTNDKGVTLTRDGLLRADRLLSEFYLPQHRTCQYW
ncbi:MAG: coproporphyrinogen III oxidase family protein [Planctomycetaceae bacterium]|nr:coproporphyrinogen III oxidase family protein [Planctomycetaceae bacterium]